MPRQTAYKKQTSAYRVFNHHLWLIITLSTLVISFLIQNISVYALSFVDNSQATFNGSSTRVTWNNGSNGLIISNNTSGTYTSPIRNTGSLSRFDTLRWLPGAPYGKELPTNRDIETGYPSGNLSMANNVAYYSLNESSGSTFTDLSGTGNNGNCTNCPSSTTTAKLNRARQFNGSSNFISTSTGNSVQGAGTASISVWIRPTSLSGNRTIYDEPTSTSSTFSRFTLRLRGNKVQLAGRNSDIDLLQTTFIEHSTNLSTNTWYHIVAIFDSLTDTHFLYVNNVPNSINATSLAIPNTNPITSPQIGRKSNGTEFYQGQMDEFALFKDRVLTAQEVGDIYLRGATSLRFQMRSCNDPSCSGESYWGPLATTGSFYSELLNTESTPPSFSLTQNAVPINQYVQYQVTFNRDTTNINLVLQSVTIDYTSLQQTLGFTIRDSDDQQPHNLICDLGIATITSTKSCSYRLKVTTTSESGYSIFVQTSGGLSNGSTTVTNALSGPTGSNLNQTGVERYGVQIEPGLITNGTISATAPFSAGLNGVNINIGNTPVAILTATGPNSPASTDLTNTSLITHRLNISQATPAGRYTQSVVYTVVPNF